MGINVDFGHGETLPEGYTLIKTIDFPVYDKKYYIWVDVEIKIVWFIRIRKKLACKLV